ncbi:unnamed protein product [Nippostrongylus brasiliensis]|uniref:DUF2045 domain containing protein n=1 Tax=Nippostrongylus brasiliensis TaxID=27835 RepID=A0A158R0B3_NIPBR|nr:unnamed protein product [Nippostrongylus brasiliensis]
MLPSSTIRDLVIPKNSNLGSELDSGSANDSNNGNCGCVGELIERIIALRRLACTQDDEFCVVRNNEVKWAKLFMEFILGTAFCQGRACQVLISCRFSAHSDDMIWYVHQMKISSSFCLGTHFNLVQVYRRSSKNLPSPCDQAYNWEETVCLNLILQQLDFYVTCAVCTKTSPQNLQIIRKNCQRVYPSPSRRRMDSKGESEEITYPKLYFAIDAFEEVFQDVVVRDGECVCVELVARDRQKTREAVVFLGSIRYDVLKQVYDAKASSTWHWAQKLMKQGGRRQEFVGMRGPQKKGYAEMAVARVLNCGYETPLTEENVDFSELANVENSLNRRRMSETNLIGPVLITRPSIMSSIQNPRGRRWQSEADTVNQYPEVEGSNIDDELNEGVLTRLWSVRGFGQAWHWLREKKRAECTPLNAYLTYVTLSWTSILQDLLNDRPKRPILTFELDSPQDQ